MVDDCEKCNLMINLKGLVSQQNIRTPCKVTYMYIMVLLEYTQILILCPIIAIIS